MERIYLVLFSLFIFANCCGQKRNKAQNPDIVNSASLKVKFTNAKWFNGQGFTKKSAWVQNGQLWFEEINTKVDTVIDLEGKYVIPPFGEAHNHNLESEYELDKRIASYLDAGVFYVKLLSSIKLRLDPLMHNYNKANGLDISVAHAPLTATDGHPIAIRKRYLDKGYFTGLFTSLEDIESHGYVTIDSLEDLNHKWSKILSFNPDFIKLNLLYSEEYEKRKNDTAYFGKKGLNPKLVPEIVKKAHESRLRVSAHVETAYDFHIAVTAGVDEIAHLPEISQGKPINANDAIVARDNKITVVTTASLVQKRANKPNYNTLLDNIKSNLTLLKHHGVTLAIGSDGYNDTSVGEFQFLNSLNIFSNLELLKMWTENSVLTTFPNRKIAKLKDGYEASFLVLSKDPLKDLSASLGSIDLKVKQGVILD